jgi:hypothetical protein
MQKVEPDCDFGDFQSNFSFIADLYYYFTYVYFTFSDKFYLCLFYLLKINSAFRISMMYYFGTHAPTLDS